MNKQIKTLLQGVIALGVVINLSGVGYCDDKLYEVCQSIAGNSGKCENIITQSDCLKENNCKWSKLTLDKISNPAPGSSAARDKAIAAAEKAAAEKAAAEKEKAEKKVAANGGKCVQNSTIDTYCEKQENKLNCQQAYRTECRTYSTKLTCPEKTQTKIPNSGCVWQAN